MHTVSMRVNRLRAKRLRTKQLLGVASVAVLLGACGAGNESVEVSGASGQNPPAAAVEKTEEQAGECVARDGASEEVLALPDMLLEPATWLELSGAPAKSVTAPEGMVEMTLPQDRTKALRGAVPAKIEVPQDTARLVDEELRSGKTVLIGTDFVGLTAASLRPNGRVVFLGHCADKSYTKPFKQFVKDTAPKRGGRQDAAAVLRAIATDPAGAETTALHDWAYLEPHDS